MLFLESKNYNLGVIQCESGFIESPLSEINFLISLAWAKGGIDVGDPMLKIEKCCEGDRAPYFHFTPLVLIGNKTKFFLKLEASLKTTNH